MCRDQVFEARRDPPPPLQFSTLSALDLSVKIIINSFMTIKAAFRLQLAVGVPHQRRMAPPNDRTSKDGPNSFPYRNNKVHY
jgi:hypothetical protein